MIKPIAIRNEIDYINYLETYNNNEAHAVEFYCNSSNIIPNRGFCPKLIDLCIYIDKYFKPIHLLSTIELPQSIFHMSIVYINYVKDPDHVIEINMPDLSLLSNLEYLRFSKIRFNNFTVLPINLKTLFIGDCEFAPHINRLIAQPGFLPRGISSIVFTHCKGLMVLPLLPPTIQKINTYMTNTDFGQRLNQAYENVPLMSVTDLNQYPQARRIALIQRINDRTNDIKKERNISEVEDALVALHYRGDINAAYDMETETPEIKEYMGGRKKSKKQRQRRKKSIRRK
jgi:hypothetical protein